MKASIIGAAVAAITLIAASFAAKPVEPTRMTDDLPPAYCPDRTWKEAIMLYEGQEALDLFTIQQTGDNELTMTWDFTFVSDYYLDYGSSEWRKDNPAEGPPYVLPTDGWLPTDGNVTELSIHPIIQPPSIIFTFENQGVCPGDSGYVRQPGGTYTHYGQVCSVRRNLVELPDGTVIREGGIRTESTGGIKPQPHQSSVQVRELYPGTSEYDPYRFHDLQDFNCDPVNGCDQDWFTVCWSGDQVDFNLWQNSLVRTYRMQGEIKFYVAVGDINGDVEWTWEVDPNAGGPNGYAAFLLGEQFFYCPSGLEPARSVER
jgi:hypothetical protein